MKKFYKLPYPIATLDIETLSLDLNSVIDEIAIVITDILPHEQPRPEDYFLYCQSTKLPQADQGTEVKIDAYTWFPNVTLQLLNGASFSQATLSFREKSLRANTKNPGASFKDALSTSRRQTLEEVALGIKSLEPQIQEMWVNHPQFDIPRLQSLFNGRSEWPFWNFHKERDVATLKGIIRSLPNYVPSNDTFKAKEEGQYQTPSQYATKKHTAVGDCMYNLWILGQSKYLFDSESTQILEF